MRDGCVCVGGETSGGGLGARWAAGRTVRGADHVRQHEINTPSLQHHQGQVVHGTPAGTDRGKEGSLVPAGIGIAGV